jgi:hypothetical protein
MRDIQASLTGIKIVRVDGGVLEVVVLQQHSLRLHFERDSMALERVEVSPRRRLSWRKVNATLTPGAHGGQFDDAAVPTDDLVEVALRDNNVQQLLSGYKQRLLGLRTP